MYSTRTRVHARIPNGHRREEKSTCRTSRRTSRRGSSCVSGSWQAEQGSRRTRRLPHDVLVGVVVGVGPMEFQLKQAVCMSIDSCARTGSKKSFAFHLSMQARDLRGTTAQ